MIIKGIVDEDFVNYKKASMYISFPYCTFKCEKDCGIKCCQNSPLAKAKNFDCDMDYLIKRYLDNPITKSIVCCGLEPLDSFDDVILLLHKLRKEYNCDDDFVVYTGYNEAEVIDKTIALGDYPNVIVKYGRFIPNQQSRFDPVLGVNLASPNQHAIKIS